MQEYPLFLDGIAIGRVNVSVEGMYCRITCICNARYTITVRTEDDYINLGKCVRESDSYVLHRFIPARILGAGEPKFLISTEDDNAAIMAVDPEKPFSYIHRLCSAKYVIGDQRNGIKFED